MNQLNLKKYKRFFAFGCSFTQYKWPTWADIIGSNIEFYENWGYSGRGNHYIFNSIIECDAKHKFNQDDLVIVMWSKIDREDRYVDGDWICAVPSMFEKNYGREWCMKYAGDHRANTVRDLAMIKASQVLLDHRGCDWTTLAWAPIINLDIDAVSLDNAALFKKDEHAGINYWSRLFDSISDRQNPITEFVCSDVVNTYRDIFINFKKCMYSVGLHKTGNVDQHPTPLEHLYYIKSIWPNIELNTDLANWNVDQEYVRQPIQRL